LAKKGWIFSSSLGRAEEKNETIKRLYLNPAFAGLLKQGINF